jgi:glycosyltransferase involved in cell wall biosynthesis
MRHILTFVGSYLPGYKAGGPIRTLSNMVESLSDDYVFKIITRDRDLGDDHPYPGIKQNEWNEVGHSQVYYLDYANLSFLNIIRLVKKTPYDVIYFNSFFSWDFTIKPLLLRWIKLIPPTTPIVVAPRGEFSAGALALKTFKKKLYISTVKILRLYKNVIWQASSEHEKEDILRIIGKDTDVFIAPDVPAPIGKGNFLRVVNHKKPGIIKCIFLSRIARMKNLQVALDILKNIKGRVEFNIYGPLEDIAYWRECQESIRKLPKNIYVNYRGLIPHEEVGAVFSEHHLFLFPTLGENFGHVIIESLVAGCPVLISDQTPWRNLEQEGVGWDLPLDRLEVFQQVLQKCVDMGEEEFRQLSRRATEYGIERSNDLEVLDANRNLFEYAIDKMRNRN